ncbi:MAG: protein kinase [Myxococcota bacterium]|nr:protein kinase [Myxococcota bacterium]MDW8361509.1 protein kinase [Myxococcales bacterium]
MTEEARTLETRRCVECGAVVSAAARFCAQCGVPLTTGTGASRRASETHSAQPRFGHEPDEDERADPLIGRIVADRYRILSLIGRGGMGVVYKVEHIHIGKLMAMKLLAGELSHQRDSVRRFRREAEAASRLSHPNTVQVFDFGSDQGLTYLVMELLEGRDLAEVLAEEGPLPFTRVARIVAQVCASVAEAHAHGIVHRDLKPENIFIVTARDGTETVKVLDFGLAKLRHTDAGLSVTRAGSILGTPYYMAPETIRGEESDPRSDVYALGAVMYKTLTGQPPFWGESPVTVLTRHLTDEVVPPSRRVRGVRLPPEADAIVLRALQKNPADRYQRADDLRADLLAYLDSVGEPVPDAPTPGRADSGSPRSQRTRRPALLIASRSDVDAFERRLRRRGLMQKLAMTVLLAGAVGAAGAWWWKRRMGPESLTEEREPNDSIAQANRLEPDVALTAFLGKRLSPAQGDHDVYTLHNASGTLRHARLEVTAIPNIDLAVDFVRQGQEVPLLVLDSGGVGEPERMPPVPMRGAIHWIRVREASTSGVRPTENVSDPYTVRWSFVEPAPDEEREFNDAVRTAARLAPGRPMRGVIGWPADTDTWCIDPADAPARLIVQPPRGLDVAARVLDETDRLVRLVDVEGPSEPERVELRAEPGIRCVALVAAERRGGRRAAPDDPYTVRIEPQARTPR